jgi:ABC-type bacteriocin/lantibiotic exporter with double-glycine peptidase domain
MVPSAWDLYTEVNTMNFYRQETRYSCAPACLRMVLSAWDVHVDEAKLRELADCTPFGTYAFNLVEAARKLGLTATRKHNLESIDDLTRIVGAGLFPIVYVDLCPIRGGTSGQYHSLVVEVATQKTVIVLDPLLGEHSIPAEDFLAAWEEIGCLTIVVSS